MCGIAGIVDFTHPSLDKNTVQGMINAMRHRGPDGEGLFSDQYVVFGHMRLSIIDVEGSRQPMANEDESVWITFNGEIYNYQSLRAELLAKGHHFRTQGDTEVLVHLYEEYGERMFDRLNGMFAFGIWDAKQERLLLARDRMGIKPLYYCQGHQHVIFASEPKAILQHPEVTASPDPQSIWHYLTYRSVPSPATLFKGIKKLKPGHFLRLDRQGLTEHNYWDIPLVLSDEKPCVHGDTGAYVDQAESILRESVKRRLISDVPLGAFLSGGVDSSLIVAMMSQLSNAPVRTYSVGFKDFPSSELPFAKMVSEQYQTNHYELVLEEECFAEHLETLTWMRDSPLSERSDVPLHLLAAAARQDVKVLLSGEGSDELFAGYPKYAFDRFAPFISIFPRRLIHWGTRCLPGRFRRMEIALRSLCERNDADRWAQWFAPFTREEKERMLSSGVHAGNPTASLIQGIRQYGALDRMLYADCRLWLPENLLERGDRMTMAASVEGRVPFLDHELVEFAFRMPDDLKLKGFNRKWMVKSIARKYLPERIFGRRKNGFEVPLAEWFRGKLRDMCYDRICQRNGLAGEILSRRELQHVLDEHCMRKKDNFLKIWTLLGLAIWYDLFCLGSKHESRISTIGV